MIPVDTSNPFDTRAKYLASLAYVPSGSNGNYTEKLKGSHSYSNAVFHFPHLQLLLP